MAPLARNAAVVLEHLEGRPGGATRGELIEATRLSRPTVSAVLHRLAEAGLVVVAEPPGNGHGAGRPAQRFRLSAPSGIVLALDMGRAHMRAAAADRAGNLLDDDMPERLVDVDALGPAALGDAVELLAAALGSRSLEEVTAIGVGMPAPVSSLGSVRSPAFLPSWRDVTVAKELRRLLAAEFGVEPELAIVVDTDARLGARGEGLHGAARGFRDFLYVKVSSGIAAGLVLDGRVYRGASDRAGQMGHVSVPPEAELALPGEPLIRLPRVQCPRCRKLDCLDNLASGRALIDQLRLTNDAYPDPLTIEHITRAAAGDVTEHPLCRQAVTNAGLRVGAVLGDLARVLDPELIVVGGLLAEAEEVFVGRVRDMVRQASAGESDVAVVGVQPDRIRRSEIDGAIALALDAASRRVRDPARD